MLLIKKISIPIIGYPLSIKTAKKFKQITRLFLSRDEFKFFKSQSNFMQLMVIYKKPPISSSKTFQNI